MFSVPAPMAKLAIAFTVGRASITRLVVVAPYSGVDAGPEAASSRCDAKMDSTSFSSCTERLCFSPTMGWLDRVILAPFAQCR